MSRWGGAAIGAGVGLAGMIALDPYLRGQATSEVEMLSPKGRKKYEYSDKGQDFPQAAVDRAIKFQKAIAKRGFDPKKDTIGITATGGTGKTTLAEILGRRMGMKVQKERSAQGYGRGLDFNLAKKKSLTPGKIYEQTHLLNIVDPDKFKAVVYLKSPKKKIFAGLKKRKYGAAQRHIYDYGLQNEVMGNMFSKLPGENIKISPGAYLKVRPEGGFRQEEILNKALRKMGYSDEKIAKMGREEQIYAISGKGNRIELMKTLGIYKSAPVLAAPEYNWKRMGAMAGILGLTAAGGAALT